MLFDANFEMLSAYGATTGQYVQCPMIHIGCRPLVEKIIYQICEMRDFIHLLFEFLTQTTNPSK